MMPHGAAFKAIRQRLTENNTEIWGDRVYVDRAPDKVVRPYIVYSFVSGDDPLIRRRNYSEITLMIKCVGDNVATAMNGAARCYALLDDSGSQDGGSELINTFDGWTITTSTVDRFIHVNELVDGNNVYHEGFYLNLTMDSGN